MLRRLFILAAVVSLGLPAVRAQEGAASHAAVIQADTLPVLLERLERDPEDIDLLVEICSQYTMRSEFAAIHPYVSRLRRAGAAHDDERALMYADLFSGQSYLLAEGSDSTRIYLDRALIRGRQCEDRWPCAGFTMRWESMPSASKRTISAASSISSKR